MSSGSVILSASTTIPTAVAQSCPRTSSMVTLAIVRSITQDVLCTQIIPTMREAAVFPSRLSKALVNRLVVEVVVSLEPLNEASIKTLTTTLSRNDRPTSSLKITHIRIRYPKTMNPSTTKCHTGSQSSPSINHLSNNRNNRAAAGSAAVAETP